MKIQILKREDKYAVRWKWGIFWMYEAFDGCWFWSDWSCWSNLKTAKQIYYDLVKSSESNKKFKSSKVEVFMES